MSLRFTASPLIVGLLAATTLLACGAKKNTGTTDGGTGSDVDAGVPATPVTPLTADTFEARIGEAICEGESRCSLFAAATKPLCLTLVQRELPAQTVPDNRNSSFDTVPAAVAEVKAGKLGGDETKVQACLDAISKTAECRDDIIENVFATPQCRAVFQGFGKVPENGRCISRFSCAPGLLCLRPTDPTPACDGICGKAGERCNDDTDCATGQTCNEKQTCVTDAQPPGAEGQPCGTHGRCPDGLLCYTDRNLSPPSVCKKANGDGLPCSDLLLCADGARCTQENQNKICRTITPPGKAGDSCPVANGVSYGACAPGLVCIPANDGQSGTCQVAKAKGEACSLVFECGGFLSVLVCDAGSHTCVDRAASGPCPGGAPYSCDFTKAFCDRTASPPTCTPYRATGAPCTDNQHCGAYFDTTSCEGPDGQKICRAAPTRTTCQP